MIKRFIAERLAGQPDVAVTLDLEGPIDVVPDGDGYAATIPGGDAHVRSRGGGGAVVGFDTVGIDIAPTDRGWLEMAFAVPDAVRVRPAEAADGALRPTGETLTVTAAKRRLDLTVAPDWGFVMAADVAFGEIAATLDGTPGRLTLAAVEATQRSEPAADEAGGAADGGVFDQTIRAAIRGVSLVDPEGAEVLTLESAGFDSVTEAMRPAEIAALTERLAEVQERMATGPGRDDDAARAVLEELAGLVAEMPLLMAGGRGAYTLTGLAIDAQDTRVAVDEARLGAGIAGLDGAASTVGLDLGLDGLSIDPEPDEAAGLLPRTTALSLDVVDLPNEALRTGLIQFLQTAVSLGPEIAAPMALGQLQAAMVQGGASLRLDDLTVVTDEAALAGSGSVTPAPESPFMVTADAAIEIAGLDALIAALRDRPAAADALPVLTVLQAMGQRATAEDGTPVRRYELEFTEAGALTLNGADLGPILRDAL